MYIYTQKRRVKQQTCVNGVLVCVSRPLSVFANKSLWYENNPFRVFEFVNRNFLRSNRSLLHGFHRIEAHL